MKKLLTIISLLIFTTTYGADNPLARRWALGVSVGGAYSKIVNPQFVSPFYKPLIGYNAGLSAMKFTKSRFSFEFGFLYSVVGYKEEGHFTSFVNSNVKYPQSISVRNESHIYSVPIKLNFDVKKGNFQIFISTGIALGYATQWTKGTLNYSDGSYDKKNSRDALGYSIVTPSAGAGIRLLLNDRLFTKAELNYSYNLILNSPDLSVAGINLGVFYCFK